MKTYVVRLNGKTFIAKGTYAETKMWRSDRKYTVRETEYDREVMADSTAYQKMSQVEKDAHDNL